MTFFKSLTARFRFVAVFTLAGAPLTCTLADAPSVAFIFPAGGQRGQNVEIRVGGHYLHGDCPFEMLGTGVTAPNTLQRSDRVTWFEGPVIPLPDSQRKEDYPWEHRGAVKIAADATIGYRRWRVWTSQGVTPTMRFVVGDLPEIVEDEVAGEPLPSHVTLPVTINGRIFPREDIDVWTFDAQAGDSYVCEVVAERVGSPLDSRLEIRDPSGQPVAENVDAIGRDSFLSFTAKVTGRYQVRIHDVDFNGLQHFVYRLTVSDGPHIQRAFPLGGQAGTETEFQVFGQRVPPQRFQLMLPTPVDSSYRHRFNINGRPANAIPLDVGDAPERMEIEPNDLASDASLVELPATLNGRIEIPGDVDAWHFEAKKGDQIEFEVRAASLGSPLDSVLAVYDEAGKQVATNDDRGKADADSLLAVKLPKDGRYRIAIRDQFAQRGGPEFAYRIHAAVARIAVGGFDVMLPADAVTLPRGSDTKLKFVAARRGGFSGPIEIRFAGLPAGVEVSANVIAAKKNDTQVTFKVDAKVAVQLQRVQVTAVATIDDKEVTQTVIQAPASLEDMPVDHLAVAIAIPTPFKVVGAFETRYADRGSTFSRHFSLDRGGYEGPIQVRLAERQVRHLQGVSGETIDVPAGQDEFDYRIKLPPWMEIGRTSRTCVMAVAEVEDEAGKKHTVSYTSHAQNDQVIILVDPGQLDLKLGQQSLAARPGIAAKLIVEVARGKGIGGDVRVEVVIPDHIGGIEVQPVVVASDQEQATLTLKFASDQIGPFNRPLVIRATALRDGYPYTAERLLTIVPVSE